MTHTQSRGWKIENGKWHKTAAALAILDLLFSILFCASGAPYGALVSSNYFAVAAFDGTNYSVPTREVSWPATSRVLLTFSNSTQPRVTYVLLSGRASGHYTRTNNIGTNTMVLWPLAVPPPPPPQWTVQTSTNLQDWTDLLVITGSTTAPMQFYRLAQRP